MSKDFSYSKGVILFSISRKIEKLKMRNEEIFQEIERKNCLLCNELDKNVSLIDSLNDLKDLIDNDELLPLPPDNKTFDFDKDEIPFPDDGLPF